MAKKKKKTRRTNAPTRKSARKSTPSRRRRRNPDGGGVSILSVIGGVVVGGIVAGATDYALSGTEFAASPTRRAIGWGVVTVGTVGIAAATGGNARGVATGVAGATAGLTAKNTSQAIGVAMLAKDAKTATGGDKKADKPDTSKPNADMRAVVRPANAAMRAVVARETLNRPPAQLSPARVVRLDRQGLKAVVMGRKA